MAYELPGETQPLPLKDNPDPIGAAKLMDPTRETPADFFEFIRAINPKQFGEDLQPGPMPFVDRMANQIGLQTDNYTRRTNASKLAETLQPAYQNYLKTWQGYHTNQAMAPTQDEAASLGLIPNASPHPSMRGPAQTMDVPQSLIPNTFDISELQANPSVGARPEIPGRSPYTGDVANPMQSAVAPIPARPSFYESPGEGTRQLELPGKPNMQAPLRPIQQQYAGANIEAMKHPRAAAAATPAGLQEFKIVADAMIQAKQDEHPERPVSSAEVADIYRLAKGGSYAAEVRPGTQEHKKLSAEAEIQEIEKMNRPDVLDATIREKRASATLDNGKFMDMAQTLKHRIENLDADSAWKREQASRVGHTQFLDNAKLTLQVAAAQMKTLQMVWAMDKLDDQGLKTMIQSIIGKTSKDLEVQGASKTFIQDLLGIDSDKLTVTPSGRPPLGDSPPVPQTPLPSVTPQAQAPVTPPVQAPQQTAEELLKELERANPDYQYRIGPDGKPQRKKR